MCGIAGIVIYRGAGLVDVNRLVALRDAQKHRGPDDAGLWVSTEGRVGLAHRRLSIIDLSEQGHQPMATADNRFHVVFNGEIYNFGVLRSELSGKGYAFRSASDTEVLLHGYREWGIGVLDRLRGMFAFALHDQERNETILARDPLGIKPLYLAYREGRIEFASETRAFRATGVAREVDPEALTSFLLWGSIAPPRTFWQGVRALPAGSWMRIREGGVEGPFSYFALEEELGRSEAMDEREAGAAIREALLDAVRHHLVADVPVGIFLSGGVDSSALLGLMSEVHDGPVRTVTLSFDVPELDESAVARETARLYGAEHQEISIRISEVRDRIPEAVEALDQPSIDGINTFFVSEAAARADLKVSFSGVGGDELFGGYATFARVPQIQRVHRTLESIPGVPHLLPQAAEVLERMPKTRIGSKLSLALAWGRDASGAYYSDRGIFSPSDIRRLLVPELREVVQACDPRTELGARIKIEKLPEDERVSALEMRQFLQVQLLRDTDAVSMHHSLEVRTPLVDRDLLRALARVPANLRRAGPAKRFLRQAPRPEVPDASWRRRKQGFTLPFDRWLRSGELPLDLPEHPWFRPMALRRLAGQFRSGHLHWSRLWALLVLRPFLR